MVLNNKPHTASYLYDQIPREFWAKVKSDAALNRLTLRDYITQALEDKIEKGEKERSGRKAK